MSKGTSAYSPFSNIPGKARLTVTVFPPDVPRPMATMPAGEAVSKPAFTLAQARQRYFAGAVEGSVTDPFTGEQQLHVSLQPWASIDPENTYVQFEWQFHPKHPVASHDRHLFNNYELTHDLYTTRTDDVIVQEAKAKSTEG